MCYPNSGGLYNLSASNYDSLCDDGSCTFDTVISGWGTAFNYDSLAIPMMDHVLQYWMVMQRCNCIYL